MNYLNRAAAPLPGTIWEQIDAAAVNAARDMLTGRRFLDVDGPYGVGLTSLELGDDDYCRQPKDDEAGAVVSRAISVPMLRRAFRLSIRRIEGHLGLGLPLNLNAVEDAAEAMARREEEFIYYGQKDFGVQGLLTAEGSHSQAGGDWADMHKALEEVLAAVNTLDSAGFRGPYALALSHQLYNSLFRRYEGTDMLQVEHLQRLCAKGVYKAPIDGAVVVDPRAGKLILGQDLMTGYSHSDGIHHEFYLSESLVMLVEEPDAICRIGGKQGG